MILPRNGIGNVHCDVRPCAARRIVDLCWEALQGVVNAPGYEHLAIGQQGRRMIAARGGEACCGRPHLGHRVVDLRAFKRSAIVGNAIDQNAVVPADHKHLAVGQQSCREIAASGDEMARIAPSPCRRIVDLRPVERVAVGIPAPRDQHRAVRQQGHRVELARGGEGSRSHPCSTRRVIEFRGGKNAANANASGDKHRAIAQQRCRVRRAPSDQRSRSHGDPAGRVVNFRARRYVGARQISACDQHPAIG